MQGFSENSAKLNAVLRYRKTLTLHNILLFVLVLPLLLVSNPASPDSPFTLQLQHNKQFRNAGFYAAQWYDIYSAHELDVEIQSAPPDTNPDVLVNKVINGEVDFGIASLELLAAYNDREPIVTYATIFQQTDLTLYVRKQTLISTAEDLTKLRISIPPGKKYELLLHFLLNQTQTALQDTAYNISASPLLDLKNGTADVIVGSSLTTPFFAEKTNIQLKPVSLEKFGLDLPGQTLFSNREVYERDRNAVDRFVIASLKGWQMALENTDELALQLTRKRIAQNNITPAFGISFFQSEQVRKLAMYPVISPGHISFQRWVNVYQQFLPILNSERPMTQSFMDNPIERLQHRAHFFDDLIRFGVPALVILFLLGALHSFIRKSNRKEYENDLYKQATSDSLTDLPNRERAFIKLDEWIQENRSSGKAFSVMFLDLDGFKAVNDTTSHHTGDLLLLEVTERLKTVVNENDWLARIGGDEFLLLSKSSHTAEIAQLSAAILDTIKTPFRINQHEFIVGVSIGVARFPDHGNSSQELLSHADAAMYSAKDFGKNRHCLYTEELSLVAKEKSDIASRLSHAIKKKELFLCYQPIVSMQTGQAIGAEALLRWKNPELGMIRPDKFIPIAEETGYIKEIGDWVISTALDDMKAWNSFRPDKIYVSVNVSPRQFEDPTFVDRTLNLLANSGIQTELLKLEITENLLLHNNLDTAQLLAQLNEGGINVFLDDFGTGYSSLSYLKNLPFRVVKVDREFVNDITHDVRSTSLVKAIVAMATELNMDVVCEGVETIEQADCLLQLDCSYAQGYLYSKPLELDQFLNHLAERQSREHELKLVS